MQSEDSENSEFMQRVDRQNIAKARAVWAHAAVPGAPSLTDEQALELHKALSWATTLWRGVTTPDRLLLERRKRTAALFRAAMSEMKGDPREEEFLDRERVLERARELEEAGNPSNTSFKELFGDLDVFIEHAKAAYETLSCGRDAQVSKINGLGDNGGRARGGPFVRFLEAASRIFAGDLTPVNPASIERSLIRISKKHPQKDSK